MRILHSPLFISCLLLLVVHQVLQRGLQVHHHLADAYLDPLLAMPIILSLWRAEKTLLFGKGKEYRLSGMETGMATLYISLVTEVLFPMISENFVGDVIDVILYVTGSTGFYIAGRDFSRKAGKR